MKSPIEFSMNLSRRNGPKSTGPKSTGPRSTGPRSTTKNTSCANRLAILRGSNGHRPGLTNRTHRPHDGFVILIVLVTVVVLTLSVYTFLGLMRIEDQTTRLMTKRYQSKYLADSGVDYARLFLTGTKEEIGARGGWWDNPDRFQAIPVAADVSDPKQVGMFSIIAPGMDDDGLPFGHRFGLVDESTKLNLNVLPILDQILPGSGREMLLALPEMTEELADSILDFIDPDDDTRDYGYESSYYSSLQPPYSAKNGPLDSLEELLLIPGMTPQLLFGLDTNRNGILDPDELATGNVSGLDSDMYLGMANYITLYSKESNLNAEGLVRVNINADDLEQLWDDLKSAFNDDWANFVIYYRTSEEGPQVGAPTEESATILPASRFPIDFESLESRRKFTSILDLVDSYIAADDGENLFPYMESPVTLLNMGTTMPILMENMTTNEGLTIPGRINIMKCPRKILEGIPGFDEEIIQKIMEERLKWQDDVYDINKNRKYETWLLVEGIVDLETMKTILPFVCIGGDVYKAEIVGYFADGAGTSRVEAVFDTTVAIPRLLNWRDKSHLPAAFSVEILGTGLMQ